MIDPFALLSPYRWATVGVVTLTVAGAFGLQHVRLSASQAETAKAHSTLESERLKWAEERARAAVQAASASEAYRATEQRLNAANRGIEDDAQRQITQAKADAAAAGTAARSLRERIDATVARGRSAACNPAPADIGPPAPDPLVVFADVLGRADARAGQLAALADERGAAGAACQAWADAVGVRDFLP